MAAAGYGSRALEIRRSILRPKTMQPNGRRAHMCLWAVVSAQEVGDAASVAGDARNSLGGRRPVSFQGQSRRRCIISLCVIITVLPWDWHLHCAGAPRRRKVYEVLYWFFSPRYEVQSQSRTTKLPSAVRLCTRAFCLVHAETPGLFLLLQILFIAPASRCTLRASFHPLAPPI